MRKRLLGMLAITAVVVAACGGAATPEPSEAPSEAPSAAQILEAATTPLSDLNIVRAEIPATLVAALRSPYARPANASCDGIAAEIRALDALLGADLRLKRQFTVLRRNPPRLQNLPVQGEVDSLIHLVAYMTNLQQEISGMLARRPLLVLPQHVGELKKELKARERDAAALCDVVNAKFPNYAPAVYMGKVPDIDLQPLIPQGTVVVQYLAGDDQLLVLALTRRGHGESDHPETGYDVDILTEDIHQFLDALGIKKVILAGHSFANIELSHFNALHPERVLKLIFLDAAYDRIIAQLVRMIEEKGRLVGLLTGYIDGPGLTVIIGSEHPEPMLRQFSLVASTYSDGDCSGTVGLIGPLRMQYSRAIPMVDHVAVTVSRLLSHGVRTPHPADS